MNAPNRPTKPGSSPAMKKPLIISASIHMVLVLLAIFGLPHILQPDIVEAVPVEMITDAQIAELTTTNKPPVKAPPKEEPKKEEPPPPKKVEPPPPKPAAEPPPPDDALKAPPKEEPKKEELAIKKEPKKEQPKKPDKKPPKKPESKKEDTQAEMDKLLNDLSPDKDLPQPETPETPKKDATPEPSPDVSRFSDVLTTSEKAAMNDHYSPCWVIMSGGNSAETLKVKIRFTVTSANTLINPEIIDQSRYNSDPTFRAAADSAIRATRNERCSSLPVFMSKYSGQTIVLNFDPEAMF